MRKQGDKVSSTTQVVKPLHPESTLHNVHSEGMGKASEPTAGHGNGVSDVMEKHGEAMVPYVRDKPETRLQVTFRVSAAAYTRLLQVAKLFNMQPTQFAKAVLYKELGCYLEPLDRRRRLRRNRERC